jgi:2-polyprenyl-3-methyl-5-hydroxy-6-metoxy-1,4-benzoquinol methylase
MEGKPLMVGNPDTNDRTFTPEKYEEFYEHHYFQPIPEDAAFDVHEVIPRFGWAFDKIEEIHDDKKDISVLDLGCLDGSFALTIAKHFGIKTTGVDLTQEGIDLAIERSNKANLPAVFFQGTIEDFLAKAAKDGAKYDVITWFEIIEHVKDVQLCIDLIDKVLAPGGVVLCSTPAFEAPNYGMDDEDNKCHVRLFTEQPKDYWAVNKYGTKRMATSFPQLLGDRIKEMGTYSELINVLYK